jgi:hypothetical protein
MVSSIHGWFNHVNSELKLCIMYLVQFDILPC